MSKKTIVSAIAALTLSAIAAGPTLAASSTYTGTVSCTNTEGTVTTFYVAGVTKHELVQSKKDHLGTGLDQCDGMGSYDTSGVLPD